MKKETKTLPSFQLSVYGDVDITNEEVLEFQEQIGTDIGTSLDIPTAPFVERQQAEFELPAYSGKKWKEVKLVTLEELDEAPLTVDADGFAEFEITGKKILTIKFIG